MVFLLVNVEYLPFIYFLFFSIHSNTLNYTLIHTIQRSSGKEHKSWTNSNNFFLKHAHQQQRNTKKMKTPPSFASQK